MVHLLGEFIRASMSHINEWTASCPSEDLGQVLDHTVVFVTVEATLTFSIPLQRLRPKGMEA